MSDLFLSNTVRDEAVPLDEDLCFIADLGISIFYGVLYPLAGLPTADLSGSGDLDAALATGQIALVLADETTVVSHSAAIQIFNGRDPGDPLLLPKNLSAHAFRMLFTFPERVAIETSADPNVLTLRQDLASAPYVDRTKTSVIEGLDLLVGLALITAQRKTELLAY